MSDFPIVHTVQLPLCFLLSFHEIFTAFFVANSMQICINKGVFEIFRKWVFFEARLKKSHCYVKIQAKQEFYCRSLLCKFT